MIRTPQGAVVGSVSKMPPCFLILGRDGIDALLGRNLQGKSLALSPILPFRTIVLSE
jgi:hypothetical protein